MFKVVVSGSNGNEEVLPWASHCKYQKSYKKVGLWLDWLIDFSGMSTHQDLFYAKRFGNYAQCMFEFIYFSIVSLFFFTWSYDVK